MLVNIIASGSTGNAALLHEDLLIDCGISFKKLEENCNIYKIKIVLITHSHGDHYNEKTIQKLLGVNPNLKIFRLYRHPNATAKVAVRLGSDLSRYRIATTNFLKHDVPTVGMKIGRIDPQGYITSEIAWATDTSDLDVPGVKEMFKYCDEYYLETNHFRSAIPGMLMDPDTPRHKLRSFETHMSHETALEFFHAVKKPTSKLIGIHIESSRKTKGWELIHD